MTDDHESDSHEHAAEHPQHEGEAGWEGNEPPVSGFEDDFGDASAEAEGATVSEEAGHGGEAEAQEAAEEPAGGEKKRSLLLPAAAVAGGVLIVAAVLYWQFGGATHNTDTIPMQMTALPPASAPAPTPSVASLPAPSDSVGDASVAPKTALVPPTVAAAAPVPAPMPTPPMPVAAAPAVPVQPAAPAALNAANSANAAAASAASSAAANATEERLTTLSNRMDDMQHSMEQAMLKLTQVSERLAQTASANTAPAAAISPELESRLNRVEQRLAQIQNGPSRSSVAAEDRYVSHRHHHVTHAAKATHKTHAAHHKAVATAQVEEMTDLPAPANSGSNRWVLRAASPDEAWVAKDDTTTELRAVHIGDNLAGVGRITAIHDQGGVWVLQGSQGSVQ